MRRLPTINHLQSLPRSLASEVLDRHAGLLRDELEAALQDNRHYDIRRRQLIRAGLKRIAGHRQSLHLI